MNIEGTRKFRGEDGERMQPTILLVLRASDKFSNGYFRVSAKQAFLIMHKRAELMPEDVCRTHLEAACPVSARFFGLLWAGLISEPFCSTGV